MWTPQASKPTVLIVDDEVGPRDALKVILRPFYTLHSADSGKTALQVLKNHPIDLITLDHKLPDCQGIALLQDIKQERPDVEVIIITGYGSLQSALDGIRLGAAGYLLKPFNVTELIDLINQTLEKKQRLDCLRDFLSHSDESWSTEQQAAKTWKNLSEQYSSLASPQQEPETRFGKYSELAPLLSDLLEAKDKNLFNHSSRVSFYATLLGSHLDLTPTEQRSLSIGSFLHDIGHLHGDMPGSFSSEAIPGLREAQLKRHPDIGAKMIMPLGLPAEVGQIISYHHECHDGSGFPYGLKGDGIPFEARIVCLAQYFDHLTVDRPEKHALSVDMAMKEILSLAGTHFSPSLVEVFLQVITQCKGSLPALALSGCSPSIPQF